MTRALPPHRSASLLAAGALLLGTVVGVGAPAHAATHTLDPTHRIDAPLTITPASGRIDTSGPESVSSTVGCPEGYRASGRAILLRGSDGLVSVAGGNRTNVARAGFGLDGNPLNLTGSFASFFSSLSTSAFSEGANTMIWTCDAERTTSAALTGDFRYWAVTIYARPSTFDWSLTPFTPAGKTATTTTVEASAVSATTATVTATVAPVAATGTVTFKNGTSTLGSAAVTNGTASLPLTGLAPSTAYTITAEYGGDEAYDPSTGSGRLTTTAAAADSSGSSVTVTVPDAATSQPGGLTIAVKPGAVSLTGASARETGAAWTGTGQLGDVTVDDDRRNAAGSAWTLNGVVSDFKDGAKTIPASLFGWTPSVVSGNGTAGAAVGAGVAGGLSTDKPLATGQASAAPHTQTKVRAGLSLEVPASAEGGNYAATLTLTLI